MLEEIRPDDGLRRREFAVGKHSRGRDDLVRQLRECGDVSGRHFGILCLPRHPVEGLQGAPAGRQGGIDVDRRYERLDRPGRVAQGDIAMPAFLEQAAEFRMQTLQPLQGGERLGNPLQIPLADRNHVQDVAVLRNADGQRLGRAERGAELIALDESADAEDFRFNRGCDRWSRGCLHGFHKKGGPKARL